VLTGDEQVYDSCDVLTVPSSAVIGIASLTVLVAATEALSEPLGRDYLDEFCRTCIPWIEVEHRFELLLRILTATLLIIMQAPRYRAFA